MERCLNGSGNKLIHVGVDLNQEAEAGFLSSLNIVRSKNKKNVPDFSENNFLDLDEMNRTDS